VNPPLRSVRIALDHRGEGKAVSFRTSRSLASASLALALVLTACSKGGAEGAATSPTAGGAASPTAGASPPASPSAVVSGQTFDGNGVSFRYPDGWQEFTLTGTSASTGPQNWSETVGIDEVNFVTVAEYTINVSVTPDTIADQQDSFASQIADLFTQAGGQLQSGPTEEIMGGLPALAFTGTAKSPDGTEVGSRLVMAFDGTTEYFVNCQYTSGGEGDILAGCDQVVSSFQVG